MSFAEVAAHYRKRRGSHSTKLSTLAHHIQGPSFPSDPNALTIKTGAMGVLFPYGRFYDDRLANVIIEIRRYLLMVLTKESVFVVTSNLISAKGLINILQTQARLDSRPKGRKGISQGLTCCGWGSRGRNRVVSKGMADCCSSPISVCSATSLRLSCSQEGPCEQLRLMK